MKISVFSRISAVFFTYRDNSVKPYFFQPSVILKKFGLGSSSAGTVIYLSMYVVMIYHLFSVLTLYHKGNLACKIKTTAIFTQNRRRLANPCDDVLTVQRADKEA